MKHLLWCLAHSYCSESVSNHYHDYVGSQIWESNTAKTKIALKKKKKKKIALTTKPFSQVIHFS